MRAVRAAALVVSLAGILSGCARVRPYQREYLSRRSMVSDKGAGEARFEQHTQGAREGAEGGSGKAGGGCGCN